MKGKRLEKLNESFKHIEIQENGVIHYESGMNQWTDEEVEKLNKEHYDFENSFIPGILEDGHIEFPMLYDNGPEPLWSSSYLPANFEPSCSPGFEEKHGLKYNIYIYSHGRAEVAYTPDLLKEFGIDNWYFCVNPSQYAIYKKHFGKERVIVRDPTFMSEDKLDLASSVVAPDTMHGGSGVVNSVLYLARALGEDVYMTLEDDFASLGMKARKGDGIVVGEKYDKDNYYRCSKLTPEIGYDFKQNLIDMMTLYDKMRNKSFMSVEKYGLVFALPISIKLGTRSYSFYMTNTKNARDHIGQHNNDIITSLESSKYGFVNAIVEGLPQYNSIDTQVLAGGVTEVYKKFGTLDKGKVLVQAQPNYSKVAAIYSRIHHFVDFNSYNKQRLVGQVKPGQE